MKKKWLKVIIPIAIITFIGLALVFGNKNDTSNLYVTTTKVEKEDVKSYVNVSGVVLSNESYNISPRIAGEVIKIYVEEGQSVEENQILFELDSTSIEEQIKETQIQLEIAKENLVQIMSSGGTYETSYRNSIISKDDAYKSYEDAKTLFEAGVYSKSQVDQAYSLYQTALNSYKDMKSKYSNESSSSEIRIQELRIESYENALEVQKKQLEDTKVYSPINGVVTGSDLTVMTYLNPGSPVMTIEDLDNLKVEVNISQYDIHKIEENQKAKITLEGMDEITYQGLVTHIGSKAVTKVLRSSQEMVIEVAVDIMDEDQKIKPNYSAKVEIETASSNDALVLPYEAVYVNKDGDRMVFTVENQKAKQHIIEQGVEGLFTFAVISDTLKTDDQVIMNPTEKIEDGISVIVTGDSND